MALEERDRRALIVFGAIVVVALAAYFLLLKPKNGEGTVTAAATSGPFTTGPVGTTPPSVAPSTSAPGKPRTPPPTGVPLGGKDPFSPIVNSSGGGGPSSSGPGTTAPVTSGPGTTAPGTSGPGTTPPTSPDSTSSPTESPTNTVSPPASPSGPPHGTSTHVDGHEVTLLDIFTRDGVEKAQVQVDATAYTVEEGDVFSDEFRLVAINGSCATFNHGAQEFILCENPQK